MKQKKPKKSKKKTREEAPIRFRTGLRERIGGKLTRLRRDWTKEYTVTAVLLGSSCLFTLLRGRVCVERALQSLWDLCVSFAVYVLYLIGLEELIAPTVTRLPEVPIRQYLLFDLDEVLRKLDILWESLWDLDMFFSYLSYLSELLNWFVILLNLFLAGALVVYQIYTRYTEKHIAVKTRKEKKKRPKLSLGTRWRTLKRKIAVLYKKILVETKSYLYWLKQHKTVTSWLVLIWLVNTNLMTVLLSFFAYYIYFIVSFDFGSLFTQMVRMVYDLVIALWTLPFVVWCAVIYQTWNRYRTELALDDMRHAERKNRGFDKALAAVVMFTGSMGKGKTRMAVDMALSEECRFRDDALKLMNRNMLRFPHFDFFAFQEAIKSEIAAGRLKNWATTRRFVHRCRKRYEENPCAENIFGYDVDRYGRSYDDGLRIIDLWDMLEWYAQEYFLYVSVCSLIIANLSIRSDVDQSFAEYFPRWNGDFFDRDPAYMSEYSRRCHIVDYDLFRLGKQMNDRNNIAGAFEFGVIVLTEIGKERGNNLENRETKKNAEEANPKNDKFNEWMKLLRHAATVEGVCFVRLITDEQRATSWGADARDTATVVDIREVKEEQTALLCNWFPYLFNAVLLPAYLRYYNKVLNRGNQRFKAVARVHTAVAAVAAHCERKINRYTILPCKVTHRDGNLETEPMEHDYYIMPKKIYSARYATDCYKELFTHRALAADYSFVKSDTYEAECALLYELELHSSYLMKGLFDMLAADRA